MSKKKIIAISSGGGHLTELMKSIPKKYEKNIVYITSKNGHTKKSLRGKKHFFIIDPHLNFVKYFINLFQSLGLLIKIRPSIIVSTGAGIAIPIMCLGFFLKLKLIYIETGARVYTPSRTAKFMYKLSDLFIVQYESLKPFFPKSKIGSL